MFHTQLFGRRLLTRDLMNMGIEDFKILPKHQQVPALIEEKTVIRCNRCLQTEKKILAQITTNKFYCPHCIYLGRCGSALLASIANTN